MRPLLSRIATLLILTATGAGCGGGSKPDPVGPDESVLTTVQVTPATATLFTVAPGNTATLAVVAKDQNGQAMAGAGSPTFSSDNSAIASVSDAGAVTALTAGTAHITASVTAGGVTKTGSTTVTAQVALNNVGVTTPVIAFSPPSVDVQAGGSVSWTFGSTAHTVTFSSPGSPPDVPELQDGAAARTFPNHGNFNYHCSIHPSMTGVVQVH